MASTSSVKLSLGRYRPVVVVLVSLTAAFGAYYILYGTSETKDIFGAPLSRSLHRSNAVHRSRPGSRRRRSDHHVGIPGQETLSPVAARVAGDTPQISPPPRSHNLREDLLSSDSSATATDLSEYYDTPRWALSPTPDSTRYGSLTLTISGITHTFPISFADLPSTTSLQFLFPTLTTTLALSIVNHFELALLDRIFYATMPTTSASSSTHATLAATGLSPNNISAALRRHERRVEAHNLANTHAGISRRTEAQQVYDPHPDAPSPSNDRPSSASASASPSASEPAPRPLSPRPQESEPDPLLTLLYNIASDRTHSIATTHRSISCSSCATYPIRGIRYRCANCADYDLCSTCEALRPHNPSHVFYKIYVPLPSLCYGADRDVVGQTCFYPGNGGRLSLALDPQVRRAMEQHVGFERGEVEAMWERFALLATAEEGIDRETFNQCMGADGARNLVCDRLFCFYDRDGNGWISFEEYVRGIAAVQNRDIEERLRRVFDGYDMDGDGLVTRKDFLRLFRALYMLGKGRASAVVRVMMAEEGIWVEGLGCGGEAEEKARSIVSGGRAVSAGFGGGMGNGDVPVGRLGAGKVVGEDGEVRMEHYHYDDGSRTTVEDEERDEQDGKPSGVSLDDGNDEIRRMPVVVQMIAVRDYGQSVENRDLTRGATPSGGSPPPPPPPPPRPLPSRPNDAPTFDLGPVFGRDPVEAAADMQRFATYHSRERQDRRDFYTDDEEESPVLLNDDGPYKSRTPISRTLQTLHKSGSSSTDIQRESLNDDEQEQQERADHDGPDDDRDSTSTTSSQGDLSRAPISVGIPDYPDLPQAEKDVGKEIIFQVMQDAFNDLLDALFKQKEDLAMAVAARYTYNRQNKPMVSNPADPDASHPELNPNPESPASDPLPLDPNPRSDRFERSPTRRRNILASSSPFRTGTGPNPDMISQSQPTETTISGTSDTPPNHQPPEPLHEPWDTHGAWTGRSAELDAHKREIEQRGGPGRLSWEEFKSIVLKSKKENRAEEPGSFGEWAFLGAWVESALF